MWYCRLFQTLFEDKRGCCLLLKLFRGVLRISAPVTEGGKGSALGPAPPTANSQGSPYQDCYPGGDCPQERTYRVPHDGFWMPPGSLTWNSTLGNLRALCQSKLLFRRGMSLSVIYTSMQMCLPGPWLLSTPLPMSEDKEKIVESHRRTGKENSASRTNELSFFGGGKSLCLRRWRNSANSSESDGPKEVTRPSPSVGVLCYASGPRKNRGIRTWTWVCVWESCLFSEDTTSRATATPAGVYPRWPLVAVSLPRTFKLLTVHFCS